MFNRIADQVVDGSAATAPLVPATLDLSHDGRLATNGVLASCDPERGYEDHFLTFFDVHPAHMIHVGTQVSGVLPKYVQAMPLLRLMSGSDAQRDVEDAMLGVVLDNVAEDAV